MLSTTRRRGMVRGVAVLSAASLACAATLGPTVLLASPALAAGACATPGGSGAGGTLTGVVNTYYPGVGTAAAGSHEHLGRCRVRRGDADRGGRPAARHPDAGRRHQLDQHQLLR